MLPPWLLMTFVVVAGVVLCWALLRMARREFSRRRRSRGDARSGAWPAEQTVHAAMAPPPLPVGPASSAGVGATALRSDEGPHQGAVPVLRMTQVPATLPQILREELPGADPTDRSFGIANSSLAELLPESDERRTELRRELHTAGFYNVHAVENFAAWRYVLMMSGLVLGGVALILAPVAYEPYCVGAIVMLPIFGWALPRLYVRSKAQSRKNEIEHGMPDLLDMLNMCVSQGLTIQDSLRRIVRDLRGVYPALAQELRIVLEQAQVGHLNLALENFSRRIDLPEVHSFTSLLTQTERMGTSVSESLATYSDTMRDSLKQRADEKGNQAAFKLLFPTVLCLMPAVYLFLLGPAVVELSEFFYRGGRDSLDQGSAVIERINSQRAGTAPVRP